MAETSFGDPRVIELSKSFVNVIANSDTGHGQDEKKLCKKYKTVPCSVHQRGMYAGKAFFPGNAKVPTTVFCDPAGKELFRKTGRLAPADLVKEMQTALAKVPGDRATLSQWKLLAEGKSALEKGEYRKSIEIYTKAAKSKRLKTQADEGLARVNEKGEELLKEATDKTAIRKIADEFKPLEVSAKARKELGK